MEKKKDELQSQLNVFKVYKSLPLIIFIMIMFVTFIWAIVDPCVYGSRYYGYGVMRLPNGFLCWFVWMLIGGVVAGLSYFFTKVACSYKVLHIHYLQKLVGEKSILDVETGSFGANVALEQKTAWDNQEDNQENDREDNM